MQRSINLNLGKFHDRNMGGQFDDSAEGGGAAQQAGRTRTGPDEASPLKEETAAEVERQIRAINQNSGSPSSQLHGGTVGREDMMARLNQANARDYARQANPVRPVRSNTQDQGGFRKGLQQPKKVSIIKNSNRDTLDGALGAFGRPSGVRRNADLGSVSSGGGKKVVSFSAERPNQEHPTRGRPDRSASKNSRKSGSQPRKNVGVYQNNYQPNSAGKNKGANQYGRRGPASGRAGTNFSASRSIGASGGARSNFNQNAQIQQKFDRQERDFPFATEQAHNEYGIAASGGGKSTKALVNKMKHLGAQRQQIPGAAGAPVYTKKQIREMYGGRPQKTGGPGGPGKPSQTMQQRVPTKNLQDEYGRRAKKLTSSLNDQVNRNVIVPGAVRLKVKRPKNLYADEDESDQREGSPSVEIPDGMQLVEQEDLYDLDLIPGHDYSPDKRQAGSLKKPKKDEKIVDYARSRRAVEMRIRTGLDQEAASLDDGNTQLIQELNRRLVELDHINEDKRDLNNQLISQIQFVRDLQANLGTADNGNIADIIDKKMEEQFRLEKQKNIQLKERLAHAEKERQGVLVQLRVLEGDKNVVVVSRQGGEVSLDRASMSVHDLMRYKDSILRDAAQIQRDLDLFTADDGALSRELIVRQQDLERISKERLQIADDLRALQVRHDDVVRCGDGELRDLGYKFRHHKTRMRGRVIYRALERITQLHLKGYFLDIKYQQKYEDQQIQSIIAFRNVCFAYRERRQRKYLLIWFQKALKPHNLKVQNQQVTEVQMKHEYLRKMLTRWHHQQIIASTEKSYQIQTMKNLLQSFRNHHRRCYRYVFDIWRGQKLVRNEGRDRLVRFVRERLTLDQQAALCRWKMYCLHQDFQIRLNCQAVAQAALHYKQRLFYGWRQEATNLRSLRTSLLLRVWKILNRNRQEIKTKRKETLFILKKEQVGDTGLLEKTFQALKLNKEQEKHEKVRSRLEDDEDVQIEQNEAAIKRTRAKADRSAMKKAVKGGVLNPFKKFLKQYWDHWRSETREFKTLLNDKIKQLLIRAYKAKIREGWTKLSVGGAKKKKRKKMVMMDEMGGGNQAMEEEIAQIKEKEKAEAVRSTNKGSNKFKKMLLKAYQAELKYRLHQWQSRVDTKKNTGEKVEKTIIKRMQQRFVRQAFDRLNAGGKRLKQVERFDGKGVVYQEKLKNRVVRKVFEAMCGHRARQKEVRAQCRHVFTNFNKKVSKHYFQRWQKYQAHKTKKAAKKKRMAMTDATQESNEGKGEMEDLLFEREKETAEMVRKGVSLSRKTLAKTIARWSRNMTADGFGIWKAQKVKFDKAKSSLGHTVFGKLLHRSQRQAFLTWRAHLQAASMHQNKRFTEMEVQNEAEAAAGIEESRTVIAQTREKAKNKVRSANKAQDKSAKLRKNQLEKIIRDKNDYFVINRLEHIFLTWRRIAHHRAAAIALLQRNMIHNLLQVGLDSICVFAREDQKRGFKTAKLRKLIQDYVDGRVRLALTLWKQIYFDKVAARIKELKAKDYHGAANGQYRRADILDARSSMFGMRSKDQTLKACFIALYDYRAKKIHWRALDVGFKERSKCVKLRSALRTWNLRADESLVAKQYLKNFTGASGKMYTRQIFDYLKQQAFQDRQLKNKLTNIYKNLSKEDKRHAFEQIKQTARINHMVAGQKSDYLVRNTFNRAVDRHSRHLKSRFDQFYNNALAKKVKDTTIRTALKKLTSWFYRDAFEKWRKNAALAEVVRFNNEEGPVRMQINLLNAEIQNLRQFLKDERMLNDQELDALIGKDNKNYSDLVEKSLCRLFLHGEGKRGENDKWILPWCIDHWRGLASRRKEGRRKMKGLINLVSPMDGSAADAFAKWLRRVRRHRALLERMTHQQLFDRAYKNQKLLADQADTMDDFKAQIDDLKHQREYLIDKVVIGQRLALARLRFSFSMAEEKAWVRWEHYHWAAGRGDDAAAAAAAIAAIGALKVKMGELEGDNGEIAEQNDGLKEGAMEGVQSLDQMEKVQKEVEGLHTQLAEQTETIMKLLGQNKQLKQLVEDAE